LIRRWYFRDHKPIREIARQLDVPRNEVVPFFWTGC
jgi:hypothetical protein